MARPLPSDERRFEMAAAAAAAAAVASAGLAAGVATGFMAGLAREMGFVGSAAGQYVQ